MAIEWIISDVDGCLTPESSSPFDMPVLDLLAEWFRQSSSGAPGFPRITLCTGRPQPYVEALAKILAINAPMICENGAVIYTLADNHSRYGPGVTNEKIAKLRELQARVEHLIAPSPELLLQFGKMAQLSVYSENHTLLVRLADKVAAAAEEIELDLHINTSHYYLNVSLLGVDKGSAIDAVMEELGVPRRRRAGIGDTEGDLAIRRTVGWFGCPANARPALKEEADFVAQSPEARGVLEILAFLQRGG